MYVNKDFNAFFTIKAFRLPLSFCLSLISVTLAQVNIFTHKNGGIKKEPLVTISLHSCTSLSDHIGQDNTKQWAFDTLSLKEKYINDAPWQSALIRGGSPWTQLFIGHRFSSGFMASDTPRKLVGGRLLGNTLRGCQLSRHASCIIL